MDRTAAPSSTFTIGGVSCSADSLVQGGSSVLRINICAEMPAHRKSANRKFFKNPTKMKFVTLITTILICLTSKAQDTIKYVGILDNAILYESFELYPDLTFKWTSEYDLSFSRYGKYKIDNYKL